MASFFNVNLSYRKAIIITLTTLQLVEKESPYVHCCFYFKITDGEELHCISEVKRGNQRVFISSWQNYRAPCQHPLLRNWKNYGYHWPWEVFRHCFSLLSSPLTLILKLSCLFNSMLSFFTLFIIHKLHRHRKEIFCCIFNVLWWSKAS